MGFESQGSPDVDGPCIATGAFEPAITRPVVVEPESVVVGHLDGDGLLDVAIASQDAPVIAVLYGRADGELVRGSDLALSGDLWCAHMADYNGDGALDVMGCEITAGTGALWRFRNTGAGQLEPDGSMNVSGGVRAIDHADLDGDGDDELAITHYYTNQVSILGLGSMSQSYATGSFPTGVQFAQMDGAGGLDLVVSYQTGNRMGVFANQGDAFAVLTAEPVGSLPTTVATGDFDGNQSIDAAVVHSAGISVCSNPGDGVIGACSTYQGATEEGLASADLDEDGFDDLVGAVDGQLVMFRGSAAGLGTPSVLAEGDVSSIAIGDMNADGALDIVATSRETGELAVLLASCAP